VLRHVDAQEIVLADRRERRSERDEEEHDPERDRAPAANRRVPGQAGESSATRSRRAAARGARLTNRRRAATSAAVDLLLGSGDEAAIDAAIVAGYARHPPPEADAWALQGALSAIRAEPW
jgi:hypothetical protein